MTEFGFYHLTRERLDRALPRLLEKVVAGGRRVVVRCRDEERLGWLDRALWSFEPTSFLPHAVAGDKYYANERAVMQPVWLTLGTERPNEADVLVLVDGAPAPDAGLFDRVVDMFDGEDPAAVLAARERWKAVRAAGHGLTYWEQTAKGWRAR